MHSIICPEFANHLISLWSVFHAVEVQNCQVISKTGAEFEDKWNPWTPRLANVVQNRLYVFCVQLCCLIHSYILTAVNTK